jgi:hypothetical protein
MTNEQAISIDKLEDRRAEVELLILSINRYLQHERTVLREAGTVGEKVAVSMLAQPLALPASHSSGMTMKTGQSRLRVKR